MIRVAIVDEHPVARRGLTYILFGATDIDVVAEVAGPTAIRQDVMADVVVLDPFPFGEAPRLHALRDMSSRFAVLAWSASRNPLDVAAALRAGARGYVAKDVQDHTYLAAVRCIARGATFLPQPGTLSTPQPPDPRAPRVLLSEREQQALGYIGRGFTHQQAATRMGVSKATVDTYIGRIRTKLRLGNKAELALAALRYGGDPNLVIR